MTSSPKNNLEKNTLHMDVDGHRVTLSFSAEPNPNLSKLVRSTLIDTFLQKNCTVDGTVELTA